MLRNACQEKDVEVGAYDEQILGWLARWEPQAYTVVAGLIARVRMTGEAAHS